MSSASVRSTPFLSFIVPIFAWSVPLVSWIFLIFSLSHSIVFLYFFALIPEEGFLISPCYSLELCIQMVCLSFSPLLFASLLFTAICKASSDSHWYPYICSLCLGQTKELLGVDSQDSGQEKNECRRAAAEYKRKTRTLPPPPPPPTITSLSYWEGALRDILDPFRLL